MNDKVMTDKEIDDETYESIADKIDHFDFGRAATLMDVMAKCATIGVRATSIGGLAAAALDEMNDEAKAIARERADEAQRLRDAQAEVSRQNALAAEEAAAKTVEAPEETIDPDRPIARRSPTATIADNNARRL